jgi:Caspase domain
MPEPRRKHALVIGIDCYPWMGEKLQLRGCVNDADLIQQELCGRFGFASKDVTVLKDEAATRDGILSALRGLLERVGRDEVVVVTYSGHGSWMPDVEGDEPDGRDETIVPQDSGRGEHPCRDIPDDEIYAWLLDLSEITPYITLIFDSCFSGGIVRDLFGAQARWVPPHEHPVKLPPVFRPAQRGPAVRQVRKGPSGFLPLSERYVLLAGCRHDECSHEHAARPEDGGEPIYHGALTYFLWKEMAGAREAESYRDVFERARDRVTAVYARQHPQMEGARDRGLFGDQTFAPMRFLPVCARDGSRITLGGGAAHGLTVGSEWAIHPQGTKTADGAPRRALARICRVAAVQAEAEIREENGGNPVQPGDRAFEHAHQYGEMRLAIEIDAPERPRKELAQAVRRESLLRLARKRERGRARIYWIPGRAAEPVWTVVGEEGHLIMPVIPAGSAGSLGRLVENLKARARYENIRKLDDPESCLKGRIGFRLLRQQGGGWQPVEGEDAVFAEGERLALEVENRFEEPVFISILDLGLSGRVHQVYPVRGAREPLAAGGTLRIGARRGEELELFMPRAFPFSGNPATAEGTEHLKLFATTGEADFELLEQGGFRAAPRARRCADPLSELLRAALAENAVRDVRPQPPVPGADWTTVMRSLRLRRS